MSIGVVIIGRNEGQRLRRCLESVIGNTDKIVYVDSGSTDGSVRMVRNMGLDILELDLSQPFTAARARNEGCKLLVSLAPALDYVQFVDGDCELIAGWLESAASFLDANKNVAMVCGRLRERYPERSIYNFLCDSEWNTAIGQTKACGGNAMTRLKMFETVDGFRDNLIAGEESELGLRLRSNGWEIWRLDIEMALHDAAMTHFRQWWKRAQRSGYAYAEGAYLHGASPAKHRIAESGRIWLWGILIPVFILFLALLSSSWWLLLFMIYPTQIIRLSIRGTQSAKENWIHALFLVLGKFPEAIGQLQFIYNKLSGTAAKLIEYK